MTGSACGKSKYLAILRLGPSKGWVTASVCEQADSSAE